MQPAQSDKHEISIQRHCMQQLLHDAISTLSHEQDCCQGLLAGRNMIEKSLSVTSCAHPDEGRIKRFSTAQPLIGIYLVTDAASQIDHGKVHALVELAKRYDGHAPGCYLLLELGHKGRVDARLFSDAEFTAAIPLNLKEDGNLYPAEVNR